VEQQGMTMREKLEHMTATYSDRLTFAKSNIHGWGLVAKVFHKAGSIVTQFKGETCRSTVADIRESRYEEDGVDCYLLKQDDDTVVDCTFQGNYARFTNHSCNPNMYSKIVKVDNENHIIFFARTDIKAGEELTYNYRFESEDGKVPCYCGAQNCRGYLC
jgi:NuA3 HAT complex component NTO1